MWQLNVDVFSLHTTQTLQIELRDRGQGWGRTTEWKSVKREPEAGIPWTHSVVGPHSNGKTVPGVFIQIMSSSVDCHAGTTHLIEWSIIEFVIPSNGCLWLSERFSMCVSPGWCWTFRARWTSCKYSYISVTLVHRCTATLLHCCPVTQCPLYTASLSHRL